MMSGIQTITVLLVEDDPGDVLLMQKAFQRAKLMIPLNVLNNGEEALTYLRQEEEYREAEKPDLILLDINLPGLSGLEVLQEIKSDEYLRRIPVVILTTSDAEEEILRSYNLGASAYVKKPIGIEGFAAITKSLEYFWFTVVKFPPHSS
jgi:CheY-like chemotaxis protein